MLTIGQLAEYAGVTVRAVRHYHQVGLLPEPERDASGYRRYGARAVVALIKIRTLANAGVPLSHIRGMLEADAATFAGQVGAIDDRLRDEIVRLEGSRKQIAQLAAGDSLVLPDVVVGYLDRLRHLGASPGLIAAERDGWILMAARWPEEIAQWIPAGLADYSGSTDDTPFDLLDALAVETDPRVTRLLALMRERGWARWTRLERLREP
ncbi:MerR family transcriptional regulator [Actinoplanes sp. CA-131856]